MTQGDVPDNTTKKPEYVPTCASDKLKLKALEDEAKHIKIKHKIKFK